MDENNTNFNSDYNQNYNPKDKKPKHKLSFRGKVVLGLSAALTVGMLAGAAWGISDVSIGFPSRGNSSLEEQLAKDTYVNKTPLKSTTVLTNVSLDNSVTSVIEENMPSIVSITCQVESNVTNYYGQTYKQVQQGAGSGILMGEDDDYYYITTNNHVTEGAKTITVTFCDDKDVRGVVKGADTTGDLAVVAVKKKSIEDSTKKAVKIAKLGDSSSVKVGDTVVAIGNALGLGQSSTVGVISALNRDVTVSNVKRTLIQTDAAINAGNSGGALLNLNGEVIGINSVKLIDDSVEGVCFAIPISNAQTIIKELMNGEEVPEGKEGYLGLSGISVSEEESETYHIPLGVYVKEVPVGGAAAKAGVQVGDVVTKLNNVGVSTIQALQARANSYKAGTEIVLTLERYHDGNYKTMEIKVTLMSSNDFGKLEYSKDTTTDQDNDLNQDNGQNQETPDEGGQGYSDEDMQKFYEYFKDYFGN